MVDWLVDLVVSLFVKEEDTTIYRTPEQGVYQGQSCEIDNIPDPEDAYRGQNGILYKFNSNLEFDNNGEVIGGEYYYDNIIY